MGDKPAEQFNLNDFMAEVMGPQRIREMKEGAELMRRLKEAKEKADGPKGA